MRTDVTVQLIAHSEFISRMSHPTDKPELPFSTGHVVLKARQRPRNVSPRLADWRRCAAESPERVAPDTIDVIPDVSTVTVTVMVIVVAD